MEKSHSKQVFSKIHGHGVKFGGSLSVFIPHLLIKGIPEQIFDNPLVRTLCLRFGFCVNRDRLSRFEDSGWSKIFYLPMSFDSL